MLNHKINAKNDITRIMSDPTKSIDDKLRVYASHTSTTAPDNYVQDEDGRYVSNPVKARSLNMAATNLKTYIAYNPNEAERLTESVKRVDELTAENREWCLVDYSTNEVKDSSDQAVNELLTNYVNGLDKSIERQYNIDKQTDVSAPQLP